VIDGRIQERLEILFSTGRVVDLYRFSGSVKRDSLYDPRQTETMIAMEMGEADLCNF
jgi:hypothetical protein